MDKKRSLIAILLSLTITLTFMPVMAFAEVTDPDAQTEAISTLDAETVNIEAQDADTDTEMAAEGEAALVGSAAVDDDVSAQQNASYNIFIGGVHVYDSNKNDVLKDGGSVKYDPATNTITLTNATIEMTRREDKQGQSSDNEYRYEYGIRYNQEKNEPLKFNLIGENKIVDNTTETDISRKWGIYIASVGANVTAFSGSGSLAVYSASEQTGIIYSGFESHGSVDIDGTSLSVDLPGTSAFNGLYFVYSNTLTLKNNAKMSVKVGSTGYAFDNNVDYNIDLVVEHGSRFTAASNGSALHGGNGWIKMSEDTKAQGVWVSTEVDPKVCTLWDGTTDLSKYKFIHIPKDHDCMWDEGVLTRPATETEEGIMTFTCKICGKTKTEAIPKLAPKLKVFAAKAVAKGKRAVKISWNKADGAERYVIYGARCGKKLKKIKTVKASKQSYTKKSLKARKNYKFRVVAQKMVDGKWTTIAKANTAHVIVGGSNKKYTNPKSLKVKPAKMTLSVGKSKSVKSVIRKVKGGKALLKHAKRLRYTSSNPAVATVSAKGKVEAVGTGSCTIYVQAVNGIWKTVSVTVN